MNVAQLLQFFEVAKNGRQPLVLASVYETEGSTYSKAGAQMLIDAEADFQGMLSGGCLEGDLGLRARQVLDSGEPQSVIYDLGKNDEELWGLGVGCDGLMRIFLQPLTAGSGYRPFEAMSEALRGDEARFAVTVIESGHDAIRPGMALVAMDEEGIDGDVPPEFEDHVAEFGREVLRDGRSRTATIAVDGSPVTMLGSILRPAPHVLVLGAGLDAEPLLRLARELGWRVTISDHRPAYVERGDFAGAEQVLCKPTGELDGILASRRFAAVIVMSHHLATDRQYLKALARSEIPYVGLLGPVDRRKRLLDDLGPDADALRERLHGPAGLELGGRGPAPIALSIVAEIQQQLMGS